MSAKRMLLACLPLLLAVGSVDATVVALKRSPGLTDGQGLSSSISSTIANGTITVYSGQGSVADTFVYTNTGYAQDLCYENSGAAPIDTQQYTIVLAKFGLSQLPGFVGSTVNKAQLRFYATGGNSGMSSVGYITSSDWSEGNKAGPGLWGYPGDFPGLQPAVPGASGAHPNGLNTNSYQNASGVTQSGMPASWANSQVFSPSKDGMLSGSLVGGTWINNNTGLYLTLDVTTMVQLWASGTPNYGLFVNDCGNYNPYMSEETASADFQPVLFVDYLPHGDPAAVTDLAASNPDWFKLDLTWTSPSANPPGAVSSYDIRMSTSPIADDESFAAATRLTGVPAPAAPGSAERFTVTGLSANTAYYFAIKSIDATNTVSAMSNVAGSMTNPMDTTAPAAITDLAAAAVKPNYVMLSWTATGDDGVSGTASTYDLRYSTSPIRDDASFAAAPPASDLPKPKAAGSAETCTVHGLLPATTYYFAIKTADEVPNWSAMSNVVTFTTLPADLDGPEAVTNLQAVAGINFACLSWTAPADVGPAGVANYDIRYSTAPIDASNWASATPIAGAPAPAAPGTGQSCTITRLSPSTTYYFAMRSLDYAEPANVSALSNVASAKTLPPIVPVTVHNPWLTNDRVADCHNLSSMAATYVNAYTPYGVVTPANNEAKAINIYNNQKRRLYHWANEPPTLGGNDINDPTYNQNVFGWGLCGRHASQACTIVQAAGMIPHCMNISSPWGHWMYQAEYDGGLHAYDTMTTMYVYSKGSPAHIASCSEMKADPTILLNSQADGRACPGLLLCGDDINQYEQAMGNASDTGAGTATARWSGNMDLRIGETFKRTWESWANEYPTASEPPFHHEASHDYNDWVNFPYWEPYRVDMVYYGTGDPRPTYRRWSNGTDTLAPDFRSDGYKAMLEPSSHGLAAYNDDAMTPDLHTAAVGVQGEAVFEVNVPFYITDASFSGDFVKTNSSDGCKVLVSTDGINWAQALDAPVGTTHVANQSLRANVFGLWQTWYIKVQVQSTTAITDAGVSNFVVTTIFEHNKGALPYLDAGVNRITLTFDNAAELAASGNVLHITYKWKEYDGNDWTIDRRFDTFATTSPYTFTITTGGASIPWQHSGKSYDAVPPAGSYQAVPRTEYIAMEITQPDVVPPLPITDLAAGTTTRNSVQLSWTATGDDGSVGTASRYDLRYSTSPVSDMTSFNGATPVAGLPAPKPAGQAETFTVDGLSIGTTYYFAIIVYDAANQPSGLSNILVTHTTKLGDIDGDGQVNLADLKLLVAAWNTEGGGAYANWNPDADLDGDNAVNLGDLKILVAHWNQ